MATDIFPSGTTSIFQQSTAPTGWVKDTSMNDYTLRLVSGSGGSQGGSVDFSNAMTPKTFTGTVGPASDPTVTSFEINSGDTVAGVPSHDHTGIAVRFFSSTTRIAGTALTGSSIKVYTTAGGALQTLSTGGGATHNHYLTGTTSFVGGNRDFSVKYVDFIVAVMS
jgi:hypothetical protein